VKVICINAKNRPKDFPEHLWLVERVEVYTVTRVERMVRQGNTLGFVLKERELVGLPYSSFLALRFRPATKRDEELIKEAESLLEELELETLTL
jgi:hypothetical protein